MIGRECDLVVMLWVSCLLCLCSVLYVYVVINYNIKPAVRRLALPTVLEEVFSVMT